MNENTKEIIVGWVAVIIITAIIVGFVLSLFYIYPTYNVWSSKKAGEAQLAQADGNRKIAILEAEAKMQSAKSLADAEIIRAKGVAEANRIIGESLKDNQEYLRYLWVNNLGETKNQVIYVPTEANLPILEAGKRK